MPRRIPTQVGQSMSRLVRGGYLKSLPRSYETVLSHPPSPFPPRAPIARPEFDTFGHSSTSTRLDLPRPRRDPLNSKKRMSNQLPKLTPQPIVYLADRVRQRFYKDHPWEALRPRTLVEGELLTPPRVSEDESVDLRHWGRNPGPEEVIACTLYLHSHHSLSLSQAYHHTLSSYHAIRAEHEHASRSALFEARSYGAYFRDGQSTGPDAATEVARGYQKEGEELAKGAAFYRETQGLGFSGISEGQEVTSSSRRVRVKNNSKGFSRGEEYLQAALDAREIADPEGKSDSMQSIPPSSTDRAPSQDGLLGMGDITFGDDQFKEGQVPESVGANVRR